VIVTAATATPEPFIREYTALFKSLGVDKVEALDIREHQDAMNDAHVALLKDAAVIFFTGGDQLRITSHLGGSPVFDMMRERYREGCTIVGTSAGAAAMSETMVISGTGDASATIRDLRMAPGLGFIGGIVIDSHFAERGRIGRLLSAVSQNPRNLGIGIDEDTALIVEGEEKFRVMGAGAVYVFDGGSITYSNLAEETDPDHILTVFDVMLHIVAERDSFDLSERRPILAVSEK
jgi:cyanophycinase